MRLTERGQSLVAFLLWTICGAAAGLVIALVFITLTPTSTAPQEVIPTSHSSQGR